MKTVLDWCEMPEEKKILSLKNFFAIKKRIYKKAF